MFEKNQIIFLEMKNINVEVTNLLNRLHSRLDTAEKRLYKVNNRAERIKQNVTQEIYKEKTSKRS